MKIILLTFIALIISVSSFSQNDTINKVDAQNRKQGYWSKSYSNGKKSYEGKFIDDKPVGDFKRFREDGSLKVILSYDISSPQSKATFYTPDGNKIAEGFYFGKEKDSLWQYYNANTELVYEERFEKGTKQGRFKQYFSNGKTYETIPFTNGQIHGTLVQFYPNGLNKTIINFAHGKQHGTLKVFYPDGTVRIEGNYIDGLKEGDWKFYTSEGKLTEKLTYTKGIPENYNQLVEKENQEIENLLKNAGKIQEPTVEGFMESMGARPY